MLATALTVALTMFAGAGAGMVRLPPRFVPGDATIAAATKDQNAPFLCQGGSTVLAVWSDNRANSTGGYEGETSWDIYGMRFDEYGNPLEAVPFAIAAGPASQTHPRAAWNGTNWLVVFQSVDFNGTGYYHDTLEAVRVAPDGHLLDSEPIKLHNMTPVGATWAVASDGSGWVVVNQGTSGTGDLVAARISAAGVLLDPGPKSILGATYYLRGGLHLAYAGGVFLLAYEESMTGSDPANAIRFDAILNVLDAAPFGLAPSPLSRMVSNGSGFYAVWSEQLPDYSMAVKGSRIGTNGKKLDGSGVNISGPNQPVAYTATSVAWDGSQWKVTWGAADGTRVARVNTNGQVLDPGGVPVAGPKTGTSASAGNGSVQLAWSDFAANNYDAFSAHINSSNVAGPNRTLSVGAPSQLRADIATSGSGYMMVYRSSTATRNRVLAQPLDAAGNPLTAEPTELEVADSTDYPGFPAVAWNGSVYMVVWNNATGVVARRLQPNGTPVDPAPVLVMNPGFGPADVESLGADFLVVGLRCGYNCQYVFPIAARVRGSDGFVLDASPIQMSGTFCSSPRLAVLGGRWLVVWQANASHDNSSASTLGTFIDAAGVKVPDFTVHGGYSSAGGNGIFSIGLASSGSVALMVQSQELTSGVETDLLGRLIDPDGTVHRYVNLTPWKDDQYRPRAAWDGSQFVVVWQDQKTDLGGDWSLEQIDARSDLMGMRISPTGTVIDPQGFVFSNGLTGEAYPNVVASGGTTLIAGSIVRNDGSSANYRIGYELFGAGANNWPVAVASATPASGDVPVSVTFGSTGSTDPDGTVAAYAWDFGDGATSSEASPSHFYMVGGPYVATLTVTDTGGAQTVQELLVNVLEPNVPPVAVSSSNITSGPMPLDVIFYAAGSYDPDGFVGNIHWTFSDGGEYWGETAYHTFSEQGTYQATLTVYDGRGGTGTAAPLTITVGPPLPPVAPSDLSAIAFSPDWINMTWTDNSNNEEGFKVERCQGTTAFCDANPASWTQIAQTGRNINYYGDNGLPSSTTYSYRVRAFNVTAHSAYSATSTATTQSYPPVAQIVPSVLHGPAPLPVHFDGSASHDPDGTIVSWAWDFGDGATGSGAIVDHTYTTVGWNYASLTVTDNSGLTATEYVSIEVKPGGDEAPAASDGSTPFGSIVSGSYLDTRTQNDVAEVLAETRTSGSPSQRKSLLEHSWSLNVAAGRSHTFYLDAWHSPNTEGDDFVFEYSRDNVSWTRMVTVTKTADNDALQSYTFTQDVTGQLWVRVRDLDQTPGRDQTDRVSIDEMYVLSSMSSGYSGEVAANGGVQPVGMLTVSKTVYGSLQLAWGDSCVVTDTDFAVYEGSIGNFRSHTPVLCSTGGATTTTVAQPAGNTYYLVVPNDQVYEGRYGSSSSGSETPVGPTRCYPAASTTGCP
jgi:PKD repeat protein